MSSVVRGVGNAVKSVVQGIGKAVKKVVSSPIGKVIAIAAAAYFLGPMAMSFAEGMGGAAAAGGTFMESVGAGLSAAGTTFGTQAAAIGSALGMGGGAAAEGVAAGAEGAGWMSGEALVDAGATTGAAAESVGAASSGLIDSAGSVADIPLSGPGFEGAAYQPAYTSAETAASIPGVEAPAMPGVESAAAPGVDSAATQPFTYNSAAQANQGIVGNAMSPTESIMGQAPGTTGPLDMAASNPITGATPNISGSGQLATSISDPAAVSASNASGPSWLDRILGFAEKNPRSAGMIGYAGLSVGGSMLNSTMQASYAKQARERELERMYNNWKVGGINVTGR